jgi:LysR family transcriptional regulator, nod-box dependent transcriptional activator
MRFQGLDLNLLVALDALLTEHNVSVAAERVNLSQSAMSGSLGRLRDFFGDELLTSVGRHMVLTPRARELIEPVRAALLQIETTITTPPVFDPAISPRHFTIMASDYAVSVVLARALEKIAAKAPNITFDLATLDDDPSSQLERGEVDFWLTLEQYVAPNHPRQLLFEDDFVVAAWAGNTEVSEHITLDQYFQMGHVTVKFGKTRHPAFDEWFVRTMQRNRRVDIVASSFGMAPLLLVGTQRIATMHRRLAAIYAAHLPILLVEAPFSIPKVRQVIQWHQLKDKDAATRWVLAQILELAEAPAGGGP